MRVFPLDFSRPFENVSLHLGASRGYEANQETRGACLPKTPRVTARQMENALRKDGWRLNSDRGSGSHMVYQHPIKPGFVTIPRHRGDLAIGTIRSILKQAGLSDDDLRELL